MSLKVIKLTGKSDRKKKTANSSAKFHIQEDNAKRSMGFNEKNVKLKIYQGCLISLCTYLHLIFREKGLHLYTHSEADSS